MILIQLKTDAFSLIRFQKCLFKETFIQLISAY